VLPGLRRLLESAVEDGTVPGAAALVACGDDVDSASAREVAPIRSSGAAVRQPATSSQNSGL
jgi:hypothetical protein